MKNVYEKVLDTYDFFDSVVYDGDDTEEWEVFVKDVADYAAEDDQRSLNLCSNFQSFLSNHGYEDKIADIIYDAMKAFTNKRIRENCADFDFI
jgi:hypothetical protein